MISRTPYGPPTARFPCLPRPASVLPLIQLLEIRDALHFRETLGRRVPTESASVRPPSVAPTTGESSRVSRSHGEGCRRGSSLRFSLDRGGVLASSKPARPGPQADITDLCKEIRRLVCPAHDHQGTSHEPVAARCEPSELVRNPLRRLDLSVPTFATTWRLMALSVAGHASVDPRENSFRERSASMTRSVPQRPSPASLLPTAPPEAVQAQQPRAWLPDLEGKGSASGSEQRGCRVMADDQHGGRARDPEVGYRGDRVGIFLRQSLEQMLGSEVSAVVVHKRGPVHAPASSLRAFRVAVPPLLGTWITPKHSAAPGTELSGCCGLTWKPKRASWLPANRRLRNTTGHVGHDGVTSTELDQSGSLTFYSSLPCRSQQASEPRSLAPGVPFRRSGVHHADFSGQL